jgi:hypothetical protein
MMSKILSSILLQLINLINYKKTRKKILDTKLSERIHKFQLLEIFNNLQKSPVEKQVLKKKNNMLLMYPLVQKTNFCRFKKHKNIIQFLDLNK